LGVAVSEGIVAVGIAGRAGSAGFGMLARYVHIRHFDRRGAEAAQSGEISSAGTSSMQSLPVLFGEVTDGGRCRHLHGASLWSRRRGRRLAVGWGGSGAASRCLSVGTEKSSRKEDTFYQERLLVFKEISPRRGRRCSAPLVEMTYGGLRLLWSAVPAGQSLFEGRSGLDLRGWARSPDCCTRVISTGGARKRPRVEKSPRKEGTFYQERLLGPMEVSPRRCALVETTEEAFGCWVGRFWREQSLFEWWSGLGLQGWARSPDTRINVVSTGIPTAVGMTWRNLPGGISFVRSVRVAGPGELRPTIVRGRPLDARSPDLSRWGENGSRGRGFPTG